MCHVSSLLPWSFGRLFAETNLFLSAAKGKVREPSGSWQKILFACSQRTRGTMNDTSFMYGSKPVFKEKSLQRDTKRIRLHSSKSINHNIHKKT